MQKGLQIESLEENPRRKYNTFKPPSSSDFQNAPGSLSSAYQPCKPISMRLPEHIHLKNAYSCASQGIATRLRSRHPDAARFVGRR